MRWSLSVLVAVVFAVVCLSPRGGDSPRAGCLWDRDTLAQEAQGNELIVKAITGRFDRFEPVYYEARLRHLEPLLEAEPGRLDLYDDVGVALDRLHRGDEAIAVMAGKRAQLDLLPEGSAERAEHEYRYLANLGTFHAHRWLRNGKDRGDLSDLQEAERLIAAAIELNPDAHFGREQYQLMAIQKLLEGVDDSNEWRSSALDTNGMRDAAEGLAGLVVLGDAWESFTIHASLARALYTRRDAHLASAAYMRVWELFDDPAFRASRSTLDDDEYEMWRIQFESLSDGIAVYDWDAAKIRTWFDSARSEADAWRVARNAYVAEQIAKGRVPEASGEFWAEWKEPSVPPELPDRMLPWWTEPTLKNGPWFLLLASPLIVVIGVAIYVVWRIRRRRAAGVTAA